MKIETNNAELLSPSQTARAQGIAPGTDTRGRRTLASADGDSVEISGLSMRLQEVQQVQSQQAAQKVGALARLYASGHYQPDATQVSRALIAHVTGGVSEGLMP